MKNMQTTEQIKQALANLANELDTIGLWTKQPPTLAQLSSQEPFCVDTMPFEQWLQWLFIPKLEQLVSAEHFHGMAHHSDIHTMATYVFKDYTQDTKKSCEIIKDIDALLNSFGQQSIH